MGASMYPSAYRMLAVALCPVCKEEFWLLDEQTFEPGSQPARYPGKLPVVFTCCGQSQTAAPRTITYRLQRIIRSKPSDAGSRN